MSQLFSAFVAAFVGFAASVAVVLAAAQSLGATPEQTVSWIAGLCVAKGVAAMVLSWRYRMPIICAWSTPGAALIAASSGVGMKAAVGAFIFAAILIILTALIRPLGAFVARIPMPIASAMLAGVIFRFVVAVFDEMRVSPFLVGFIVLVFLVVRGFNAFGAVIAALLAGIVAAFATGLAAMPPLPSFVPSMAWITPGFEPSVIIGMGLPLYLVTMAAQNLPGFAVLRQAGYEPPAQVALAVTGLTSLMTAPFGAHMVNMAAISAAICTGPDTHPDPSKRWLAGMWYGIIWCLIALLTAPLLAIILAMPKALIVAVAGLGLIGSLAGSLGAAMADDRQRFAAVVTLAIGASGLSILGIGAAFWALCGGLITLAIERAVAHLRGTTTIAAKSRDRSGPT
ncbi:MAG: benzoate/H(+) symporter BenE family transporter [Hyphomicrobiales bacterium]|nr:benzoate/H(+) symporter BenE family transporter [Hyphomicrobiales bacterium]